MRPIAGLSLSLLFGAALPATASDQGYQQQAQNQGRPMLGVVMSPVPLNVQEKEGLSPNQGVLVQDTFPNTAAQGMGIQKGDVILAVNGSAITSMTDLRNEVSLNQVNDPVDVTYQRNGQLVTVSNQFKPWPPSIPYDAIDPAAEKRFQEFQQRRLAQQAQEIAQLREQADQLRKQLGLDDPAKPAGAAGAAAAPGSNAKPQFVAWRFRYGIGFTPPIQAASVPGAAPIAPVAPAPPAGTVPWRFVWRTWNPAHHEVIL